MPLRALPPLLFGLFAISLSAQTASPTVVSTGGGDGTSSGGRMTWTIGELSIATVGNSEQLLTQGFQQPVYTVVSVEEADHLGPRITLYPNPADELLMLQLERTPHNEQYMLLDAQGKTLLTNRISEANTTIPVANYPPGAYFLRITDDQQQMLHTFKIIISH